MQQKRVLIGFDCNETFDFDDGYALSRSSRGEAILHWALRNDLILPLQQGHIPSYFPYNTAQQPRRLDYVFVRGLHVEGEGEVLEKTRTMMGSAHDAVAIRLSLGEAVSRRREMPHTLPRHLSLDSPSRAAHGDDVQMDTTHQRENHKVQA